MIIAPAKARAMGVVRGLILARLILAILTQLYVKLNRLKALTIGKGAYIKFRSGPEMKKKDWIPRAGITE